MEIILQKKDGLSGCVPISPQDTSWPPPLLIPKTFAGSPGFSRFINIMKKLRCLPTLCSNILKNKRYYVHHNNKALPALPTPCSNPYIKQRVDDKWTLHTMISSSERSSVFLAVDDKGKRVVVKTGKKGSLSYEASIYSDFHHIVPDWGLSKLLHREDNDDIELIVLEHLGISLEKMVSTGDGKPLSVIECLEVAFQMIYRLETIHNLGIAHGNIEPGNILIGRGNGQTDTVFLIDFRNARYFRNGSYHEWELPFKSRPKPIHLNFAPIAYHERKSLNRRDDVESLMYVILFACNRFLPWENVGRSPRDPYLDIVKKLKKETDLKLLYEGLPSELVEMHLHVKSLAESEMPNYHMLRTLISHAYGRLSDFIWERKQETIGPGPRLT